MLGQCRRLWVNIETVHWVTAMCLLMYWHKVYNRPSVGLVLGQRCRRLTGIEQAMGCDAGSTLSRIGWVSLHRVYEVHGGDAYTEIIRECHSTFRSEKTRRSTIHSQVLNGCGTACRRYILTCLLGSFHNYILLI